jgi:hypothetical protein
MSAINAIMDDISIKELSSLKYRKSPYETIRDNIKEDFPNGFNFNSSTINSDICKFRSYAINKIFKLIKGKSILVIGADLCIVDSLINSDFTDITIVEGNCMEIYGEEKSEGYIGIKEYLSQYNGTKKIDVIWGKLNNSGIQTYTKNGQSKIKTLKHVDIVFFNHYENLLHDGKTFNRKVYDDYMDYFKKKSSYISGMYFDGDKIREILKKQDCILFKNRELHPLWKLYTSKEKIEKYKKIDIFTINKSIKFVELQQMSYSYITTYQPLIFKDNVNLCLKYSKLKSINHNTLKSFYTQYKSHNNPIDKYDMINIDILSYFISEVM